MSYCPHYQFIFFFFLTLSYVTVAIKNKINKNLRQRVVQTPVVFMAYLCI